MTLRLIARLVVAGVLLCAAAGALGRHWWLFDLFSHFRVHYAALLLIAGAILVLRRDRWIGSTAVIAALAIGWPVLRDAATHIPTTAHAVQGPTLRLLTLNAWFRNRDNARIAAYIERTAPDVVFLQELDSRRMRELLPLLPSYPYAALEATVNRDGAAIVSRWPLKDSRAIRLDGSRVHGQTALLQWQAQSVPLLAVHLTWPLTPREAQARNEQWRFVTNWMRSMRGPWIAGGDLNLTPWSPHFRLAAGPAIRHCTEHQRHLSTWPSSAPALGIQIDHCFASPDWNVSRIERGPDVGSDHRPMHYELTLTPRVRAGE